MWVLYWGPKKGDPSFREGLKQLPILLWGFLIISIAVSQNMTHSPILIIKALH